MPTIYTYSHTYTQVLSQESNHFGGGETKADGDSQWRTHGRFLHFKPVKNKWLVLSVTDLVRWKMTQCLLAPVIDMTFRMMSKWEMTL